jgi:hypothetical protein
VIIIISSSSSSGEKQDNQGGKMITISSLLLSEKSCLFSRSSLFFLSVFCKTFMLAEAYYRTLIFLARDVYY